MLFLPVGYNSLLVRVLTPVSGPNVCPLVFFNTESFFIGYHGDNQINSDFIGRMLNSKDIPIIGIQDTETHLRRRKTWNRGMTAAAIREYEPLIAKRVCQLVERLEENVGVVTIGSWFNFFACVFSPVVSVVHLK